MFPKSMNFFFFLDGQFPSAGSGHFQLAKPGQFNSAKSAQLNRRIQSDEWYRQDSFEGYNHVVIDHKNEEYVRDAFHTNTIEVFWSILKRGIYGIYHPVSP
jgi:hypothetical protein